MNKLLKVSKLNESATLPTKGSAKAAGYDLSSIDGYTLQPGERRLFKTGLSFEIPEGMYGRIAPRSGLAFKRGIDVLAGVIDEDYRGEVGVILINLGRNPETFVAKDKIAQIIFEFYNDVDIIEGELENSERGAGGFGSTDKKS